MPVDGETSVTPVRCSVAGGPSERSLIGPDGFYLDCGHSGTGSKIAPAVGEALAELICEGRDAATVDLAPYSLDRFARGAPSSASPRSRRSGAEAPLAIPPAPPALASRAYWRAMVSLRNIESQSS
jgi:hypothetical protein